MSCRTVKYHVRTVLFLFVCFSVALFSPISSASAQTELLIPKSGSTLLKRHPETHLVLRQSAKDKMVRVQIGQSMRLIDPLISSQGEDGIYQHYRLPLKSGSNSFILVPGGEQLEYQYKPIQSELNLNARGRTVFTFHQDDKLPASCAGCHDLQGKGIVDPVGLKNATSCASCHSNLIERSSWKHSATKNNQCLACHQQSTNPWRIGLPTSRIRDLCLGCHTGKEVWFKSKVVHGPLNLGGCTLCHDPHGGAYRHQLWADGAVDLCIACHSDMSPLVTADHEKKIPYVHGVITGSGCIACHNPHASDHIFVLNKPINELCGGCHAGVDDGGHPVERHPVAAPRERLRPNRQLSCSSCHEPHASFNRYLLIESNRGGRLCRECHGR